MLRYLTVDEVVTTHAKTVEKSGGGLDGLLHPGQLESILEHMQNDDYYPTVADKLAHLFFGLSTGHCFTDGNKRIAITATAQMLLNNGYMAIVQRFLIEMENVTVHVAKGVIERDLLRDLINCHLNLDPDNEEIKLRLYECISIAIPPDDQ